MSHAFTRPIPGTDAYWADRRAAFDLIRRLEDAYDVARATPQYYGTGTDIVENIGPWDDAYADLEEQARANPTVMEILKAQNRFRRVGIWR